MFSPSVSRPFTWMPGSGSNASYCAASRSPSALNDATSPSRHQGRSTPWGSYLDPWSSKPWPISWPITLAIAP